MPPTTRRTDKLPGDELHASGAALVDALAREITDRVLAELRQTPEPRFLSKQALAEYLGVSERTVKTLRERGLPARRIGRLLFFDTAEVSRFIDAEGAV
jgi:excisionase family DNA binding protein